MERMMKRIAILVLAAATFASAAYAQTVWNPQSPRSRQMLNMNSESATPTDPFRSHAAPAPLAQTQWGSYGN